MNKFILLITTLILISCNSLAVPPVSVPFDIATKGATSTINFIIKEENQYPFLLSVYWDPKNKIPADYDEKEKAIKLKITKLHKNGTDTVVTEREFFEYPVNSYNYSGGVKRYFITRIKLEPGEYKAYVTSLNGQEVQKRTDINNDFMVTQPRLK